MEPDPRKMAELLAVAKDNDVPVDATSGAALQVRARVEEWWF